MFSLILIIKEKWTYAFHKSLIKNLEADIIIWFYNMPLEIRPRINGKGA